MVRAKAGRGRIAGRAKNPPPHNGLPVGLATVALPDLKDIKKGALPFALATRIIPSHSFDRMRQVRQLPLREPWIGEVQTGNTVYVAGGPLNKTEVVFRLRCDLLLELLPFKMWRLHTGFASK